MALAKRFEDLIIWQNALELALINYKLFDQRNLKFDFVLKDQMIRSSNSISNNIAEGFEHTSNKQFLRYLSYAKASIAEYRSQIIFIYKLGKISAEQFLEIRNKTQILSKQIQKFCNSLK